MTEQRPSPSKEAMDLAERIRDWQTAEWVGAAEIDALCEQRVSAETERCANLCKLVEDRSHDQGGEYDFINGWEYAARQCAFDIRAPAERPAPEGPQQPRYECVGLPRHVACTSAPGPDCPKCTRVYPSSLASTGEQPDCNTGLTKRQLGFRDGMRRSIEWLHDRANHEMNDTKAKAILNSAATNLGWALSRGEFSLTAPPTGPVNPGSAPNTDDPNNNVAATPAAEGETG